MDEFKRLALIYGDIGLVVTEYDDDYMTVKDAVKGTAFEHQGFPTTPEKQDEVINRITEMYESTSDPEARQSCKDVLQQAFAIKSWLNG